MKIKTSAEKAVYAKKRKYSYRERLKSRKKATLTRVAFKINYNTFGETNHL